ncbi:MAG: HEAT repeat domain-containing protein [Chloroflexota bacterium]|nr:HEAT repeat domain-containing protein [Chloroflexota bacterium]
MPTPTSPEALPDQKKDVASALLALARGNVRASDVAKFSDLDRAAVRIFAAGWPQLPESTRADVVREMNALSEDRLDINFGRALRVGLNDASPEVRQLAVEALWEDDRSDLAERLLELLDADPSVGVRVQAARALARFAAAAAEGDSPVQWVDRLRTALIEAASNEAEPSLVQRAALEAVAVFQESDAVHQLIRDAYDSGDADLEAGAIHAMGHSGDERWLDPVLDSLEHDDPEMRYEAARACGHLLDERALPRLRVAADDEDPEVRHAAISSISRIGGKEAVRLLESLAEDAPEADIEIIDDALEEVRGESLDGQW